MLYSTPTTTMSGNSFMAFKKPSRKAAHAGHIRVGGVHVDLAGVADQLGQALAHLVASPLSVPT
jgi:hypothetical protein